MLQVDAERLTACSAFAHRMRFSSRSLTASVVAGVWDMPLEERWQLYHKWSGSYHDALKAELMALLASHDVQSAELKVCRKCRYSGCKLSLLRVANLPAVACSMPMHSAEPARQLTCQQVRCCTFSSTSGGLAIMHNQGDEKKFQSCQGAASVCGQLCQMPQGCCYTWAQVQSQAL